MLDKTKIGHQFGTFTTDVEKGRLRFFAKSIGESNPIYTCEETAKQQGYKTLPAPPTFAMVLDMEAPDFLPVLDLLDLDISRILHGSQEFDYLGQIYAGDQITITSKIKNMFAKKGGALEFVVLENEYSNQHDKLVSRSRQTLVYRNT